MKIRACLMTLIFFSLAACAQKSSETTLATSGSCADTTLDAYSKVVDKSDLYEDTLLYSDLTDLLNQCAYFKNLIGSQTCKVTDNNTKSEVTLTQQSKYCQKAEAKMASLKATQDEVIAAPSETTSTPKNKSRKKK